MLRRTALTTALLSAVFLASIASADVPPPVGDPPGTGTSPGTGSLPPIPPPPDPGTPPPAIPPSDPPGVGNIPPIPPPSDRGCDPGLGNQPPPDWYSNMYSEIYYSNVSIMQFEEWAYSQYTSTGYTEAYDLYVYASYMRTIMTQYYWSSYNQSGQPISFSFGRATRGDFNYAYDYWVRPMYYEMLRYSTAYYQKYSRTSSFDMQSYSSHLRSVTTQYHKLTRCNFGKNGTDPNAKDDTAAVAKERAAGN